jgi:hypothetical protein
MSTTLASAAWPACLSALTLDRWLAEELPAAEAERVGTHVDGCERCAAAWRSLRETRDATVLPPLRAVAPRRVAWRPGIAALAAGLAIAAGFAVSLRPDASGQRVKGSAVALGMWVRHGEAVRRAAPGEAVAPGDDVRFSVTTPRPAWVAVLSVDPAGRASIYFPEGTHAAAIAPGTDVPLPLATRLDATVGEERVLGLFCDGPVELEPVRAAIERSGDASPPPGCEVTRWRFVKR